MGPYAELTRDEWRALRANTPLPLGPGELDDLRGLGVPVDLGEVEDVYLPLSRLLALFATANARLRESVGDFLAEPARPAPFVIGVAGSVAVGKSTTSRLLRALLSRGPRRPQVELVATDSFLYPNEVLAERGLMDRKGFPETYDHGELVDFVAAVKAGAAERSVPVYSHLRYDILPGERQTVRRPDILIVEGLHVLAPPSAGSLAVSDLFDFTIYVDARMEDIRQWFIDRLLVLRRTTFADPRSFFHRFAELDDDEFTAGALQVWQEINEVNLVSNILPTRARATLILYKAADHSVQRVRLRRI